MAELRTTQAHSQSQLKQQFQFIHLVAFSIALKICLLIFLKLTKFSRYLLIC